MTREIDRSFPSELQSLVSAGHARLDAVMVPEPAKGEAPRKAKVAKEWKDVRKRM